MKYLVFISLLVLVACGTESSSTQESKSTDLTGFNDRSIDGTSTSYVYKTDSNGFIEEEGFMKNGKKEGTWVAYHPGTHLPMSITSYVNGQQTGIQVNLDARGQVTDRTAYFENKLDGIHAKYKYGKPAEIIPYQNGAIHGTYEKYFDGRNRGKIQQRIDYKDGKQHGEYTFYNEKGKKTLQYEYKNGEKISGGMVNE